MLSLLALYFWLVGYTQGLSWSYQDLNTHAECILGRYPWSNESIFLSLNSTCGETTDEPFSLSRHHERSLYIFLVRVKIEWVAKHVLVCHHSLPLGVLASDICCIPYDLIFPLRKEFEAQPHRISWIVFLYTYLMKCSHLKGRFWHFDHFKMILC